MRFRLIAALSIAFVALALAVAFETNARLQLELSSIPANRIAQVRQNITNKYDRYQDLFGFQSMEFKTETNDGVISAAMLLDFASSNKAVEVWSQLTNFNFPSGVTGFLSFHMCAIASSNTNGYWPCYSTNAFYMRRRIP